MALKNLNNGKKRTKAKKAVAATKVEEPEVKRYEWADLVMICKCGHVHLVKDGMQEGVQLTLLPTENSFIRLMCEECGSELTLQFVEGKAPEITEQPILDESVQEENKQETSV